jgi:hypothetical protein
MRATFVVGKGDKRLRWLWVLFPIASGPFLILLYFMTGLFLG